MGIRSGQTVVQRFTTHRWDTGAVANVDSGVPSATLIINGVDNVATVTVTNVGTGEYNASVVLPTLAVGDVCSIMVRATVNSIQRKFIIWYEIKDVFAGAIPDEAAGSQGGLFLAGNNNCYLQVQDGVLFQSNTTGRVGFKCQGPSDGSAIGVLFQCDQASYPNGNHGFVCLPRSGSGGEGNAVFFDATVNTAGGAGLASSGSMGGPGIQAHGGISGGQGILATGGPHDGSGTGNGFECRSGGSGGTGFVVQGTTTAAYISGPDGSIAIGGSGVGFQINGGLSIGTDEVGNGLVIGGVTILNTALLVGTVSSATSNTVVFTTNLSATVTDSLKGCMAYRVSNLTGIIQKANGRKIISWDPVTKTATIRGTWLTTPSANDKIYIERDSDEMGLPQAEPTAVPAANAAPIDKIAWLQMLARNKVTETNLGTQTVYADNGTTVVATAAVSDDNTTFTRAEWL